MAPVYSASASEVVTVAQLMGEAEYEAAQAAEEQCAAVAEAEARLETILSKWKGRA